ncbi:bleomycin resistance protein [Pseudoroseicyclus sp. CXY001]|uniref:bleomycin resistance protein n=1 Tax=Pseudoroseicyclus sp. CXY001 TaxID=3242492 RepID=UPI003570F5EC
MADRITANLPARDMAETAEFYAALGFVPGYRSDGWMILERGALELEFFHAPGLIPAESWHSACIRVDDLDALYDSFAGADLPATPRAIPRLTPPERLPDPEVPRLFFLVDLNGSLLRCLEN